MIRFLSWRMRTGLRQLRVRWRARRGTHVPIRVAGTGAMRTLRWALWHPRWRKGVARRAVYLHLSLDAQEYLPDEQRVQPVEAIISDRSVTLMLDALFEGEDQASRQRAFARALRSLGGGLDPTAVFIELDCASIAVLASEEAADQARKELGDGARVRPAEIAVPLNHTRSTAASVLSRFDMYFDFVASILAQRHHITPVSFALSRPEHLDGFEALRVLDAHIDAAWRGGELFDGQAHLQFLHDWQSNFIARVQRGVLKADESQAVLGVRALRLNGSIAQCQKTVSAVLSRFSAALRRHRAQAELVEMRLVDTSASFDTRAQHAEIKAASFYPLARVREMQLKRRTARAQVALAASLVVLVCWVSATFRGSDDLQARLVEASRNLEDYSRLPASDGAQPDLATAQRLLGRLVALRNTPQRFFLALPSWFDDRIGAIEVALAREGYRIFISPRMAWLSREVTQNLTSDDLAVPPAATSSDELPAAVALRVLIAQQEKIDAVQAKVGRAGDALSAQDVMTLLGERNKAPTRDREALEALPTQAAEALLGDGRVAQFTSRTDVERQIAQLWDQLLAQAFDQAPVMIDAARLVAGCDVLVHANLTSQGWSLLARSARSLTQLAREPGSVQIIGTSDQSARFFEQTLARISETALVSTRTLAEMADSVVKRRDATRVRLLTMQVAGLGGVFDQGPSGILSSASSLKNFSDAINQTDLQRLAAGSQAIVVMPRGALYWTASSLSRMDNLHQSWASFQSQGANSFDSPLRGPIVEFARQSYQKSIAAAVSEGALTQTALAQHTESLVLQRGDDQALLQQRAEALLRVSNALRAALPAGSTGEPQTAEVIARVKQEVQSSMADLSSLWRRRAPYEPVIAAVRMWVHEGSIDQPPSYSNGGSFTERAALVQRSVQGYYAGVAETLLKAADELEVQEWSSTDQHQWRAFLHALAGSTQDNASNGLLGLQQTLRVLDSWHSPAQCQAISLTDGRGEGNDLFSSVHLQLLQSLITACSERMLAASGARKRAFAAWFNQNAAGHAPFGNDSARAALTYAEFLDVLRRYRVAQGELARPQREVDVARSARDDYTPDASLGSDDPVGSGDGLLRVDEPADVQIFRRQMDGLSEAFLGPSTSRQPSSDASFASPRQTGDAPSTAGFAMKLVFREPRDHEVLGNQIIAWTVRSGGHEWSLSSGAGNWTWQPGDSITVTLRFATGSAWRPISADESVRPYHFDDRTVTYQFEGTWALLSMLSQHAMGENASGSVVLGFDVLVAGVDGNARARVFATLQPNYGQRILTSGFPRHAPLSPQSDQAGSSDLPELPALPRLPAGPLPPRAMQSDDRGADGLDTVGAAPENVPFALTQAAWKR
ncbi:hypothetical protein [Caballeronia zhejiangensis]|uniref:hypothetical protein n=1 Tax=Caballeronia zhejiangensis TaxID=871203 RepID=UPI001ABB6FC9|nr:hypothetical protein [Caballeronia zhejiangensis]